MKSKAKPGDFVKVVFIKKEYKGVLLETPKDEKGIILFDERNCHSQCYGCNVMKKGNMVKYYKKMLDMYGQSVINELEKLDTKTRQYKTHELKTLLTTYKEKLELLKLTI